MEKLRVLFLCPQPLWPTNTGARLRNFHLAHAVAGNCQVTVLQITNIGESVPQQTQQQTQASFQQVLSADREKSYTPTKLLRGLLGPMPVTVLNYSSDHVARLLADTLAAQHFDVVQMESIHLFRYLETVRSTASPPAVVLDWHNIESELMQRFAGSVSSVAKKLVAARTATLLRGLEDKALHSIPAHLVVSEREREKLLARAPKAQIRVIPNGVDTATFQRASATLPAKRRTLLFVGSMDYHANSDAVLSFCREIWPQLAAEFPNVDFKIVGRNPPPSVQALDTHRIHVTGTVDDVRPFYQEAFAVLVPLRVGGGTRLKILEAMAAGVPVISTRLGAEGLNAQDQHEILLADTADDMSAAIRSLLSEPDLSQRLCEAARALVVAQYDWSVLGQQLVSVYRSLQNKESIP